jgi:mono/diheme cytochrome c family protein
MRSLKLGIVTVAAVAAIAACGGAGTNNSPANNGNKALNNGNSAPVNAGTPMTVAQVDDKQLYADNCMICHKETGKGGPVTVQGKKLKPADLTSDRMKKKEGNDLIKDIQEGDPEEGMPAFKDKLKVEEIKHIIDYIKKLQDAG